MLHRIVALVLGAVSAGDWLMFVAANGVARGNDTRAYLRLADALWSLRVVTSARTPGYPMFLVACRAVAAALAPTLAGSSQSFRRFCCRGTRPGRRRWAGSGAATRHERLLGQLGDEVSSRGAHAKHAARRHV